MESRGLSVEDIDRAVRVQLKRDGLEDIPEFHFGKLILSRCHSAKKKFWADGDFESVVTTVVEDTITWRTIHNKEGDHWKDDSLAGFIRTRRREGKSDSDIRNMLGLNIYQQAVHVHRHIQKVRVNPNESYHDRTPAKSLDQNAIDDEDDRHASSVVSHDRTRANPAGTKAHKWMSFEHSDEYDPELRQAIAMIDEKVQSEGCTAVRLLWQAMKQEPEFDRLKGLLDVEPEFEGTSRRLTLEDMLDMRASTTNIYYIRQKLERLLGSTASEAIPFLSGDERKASC